MSLKGPVLGIVAWGALAFGGVYDWAYWPLLVLCVSVGLWGLLRPVPAVRRRAGAALLLGLLLVITAISVQLIPLERATLLRLSPPTDAFLRQYDVGYAFSVVVQSHASSSPPTAHPISINPDKTRLGLAFAACFGLFLLGLQRGLSGRDLRTFAPALTAFGVLMALIAIVQKALWNGMVYGFWKPESSMFGAFGSFINRNHFAGWMLMALSVATAYFASHVARGMAGVKPDWRSRVVWLSTPGASRAVLSGAGVLVMGLALTMTLSRSGITCLLVALLLSGVTVMRRQMSAARGRLFSLYLAVVFVAAVSWTGLDAIIGRFSEVDSRLGGRAGTWTDAWRIHEMFPTFGTGLNTFGTAATLLPQFVANKVHYDAVHSDYLQLLSEGGYLVAAPTALMILIFAFQVRARFRERCDDHAGYWLRLGAVTGLVAIAFQETVEFSLQLPGNAALFTVLCAIAVRRSSRHGGQSGSPPQGVRNRVPAPVAGIALVVFATLLPATGGCQRDTGGQPVVQTVYSKDTRKLTLLAFDTNHDLRADIWFHMDGTRILRIEIDSDLDGVIDRWEYYTVNGALERVAFSRANDGREDAQTSGAASGAGMGAATPTASGGGVLATNRSIVTAVAGVPAVAAGPDAGGSR